MVSSAEKNKILRILYDKNIKGKGIWELGHRITTYDLVLKESGLEDYVFSLAFKELCRDGYATICGLDDTITAIAITEEGQYFVAKNHTMNE